ncbi:NfeD family protein [Pseudomonas syringae pv. actinidiae]|nr:NfeD family protein [Pseudomonas syringae pv. actinidiae]
MLYIYLIIGILLIITDMMIGTVWILAAGIGALVMSLFIAVLPEASVTAQVILVVALSIILPILVKKYSTNKRLPQDTSINNPESSKTGMICVPMSDFQNGRGRVLLGDSSWSAQLDGEGDVKVGEKLVVASISPECILIVNRVPSAQ